MLFTDMLLEMERTLNDPRSIVLGTDRVIWLTIIGDAKTMDAETIWRSYSVLEDMQKYERYWDRQTGENMRKFMQLAYNQYHQH